MMGLEARLCNHYIKIVVLLLVTIVLLQWYQISYIMKGESTSKVRHISHHLSKRIHEDTTVAPNKTLDAVRKYIKALENAEKMDGSGTYLFVPNLAKAAMLTFNASNLILTLCTQSNLQNLYEIIDLVKVWDGPISVSVFAHGHDVNSAAYAVAYYRTCYRNVTSKVSFHLVFPITHRPHGHLKLIPDVRCRRGNFVTNESNRNYFNADVPYPHNVLRNIAVQFSETPYIFVIDVDMVTSRNLYSDFSKFIKRKGITHSKTVYVTPVFESQSGKIFYDKSSLRKDWDGDLVRQFYVRVCAKCHNPTDYERWWTVPVVGFLDVGYSVDWIDAWEPLYIAHRHGLPQYDGRFKQYGFNRISQVCIFFQETVGGLDLSTVARASLCLSAMCRSAK